MARLVEFGRSGSGKSWYFGRLLEESIPKFDFAVHFDVEDEEQGLSLKDESLLKTFYVDREFANQKVEYEGREMWLVEAVVLHNRKVRIVPDSLTPQEQQEIFAIIADMAMKVAKQGPNFQISADEAHQVIPDVNDPDDRVTRMLTGGRKKGVEWLFCTQRPAKLNEDAFTQANYGVYFSLTKDNDLARVNSGSDINAYQTLPKLREREFVLENLDDGTVRKMDTNKLDRKYPHFAEDDGVADDVIVGTAAEGEMLREPPGDRDQVDDDEVSEETEEYDPSVEEDEEESEPTEGQDAEPDAEPTPG